MKTESLPTYTHTVAVYKFINQLIEITTTKYINISLLIVNRKPTKKKLITSFYYHHHHI